MIGKDREKYFTVFDLLATSLLKIHNDVFDVQNLMQTKIKS